MEVVLGTPPPPPPPNVPDLNVTQGSVEGRMLTTRQRMEIHRANPTCNACHQFMDPIGLALDNFEVTGAWRIKENGAALDEYDLSAVTPEGGAFLICHYKDTPAFLFKKLEPAPARCAVAREAADAARASVCK